MSKTSKASWPGWVEALIAAVPTDRLSIQSAAVADIPDHLFKLWIVLARFADGNGVAWPSLTTLAKAVGKNRRNVVRALDDGEARGLWSRMSTGNPDRTTTRYKINRLEAQTPPVTRGADATTSRGARAHKVGAQTPPRTKPRNKAINSKRQRDALWDAVADLWFGGRVDEPDRKRVGKLVTTLMQRDATPDDLRTRRARYMAEWPTMDCTPEALIKKHWRRFDETTGGLDAEPIEPPDEVFAA